MPAGAEPHFQRSLHLGRAGRMGFGEPEIDGAVVARAGAGGDVEAADEGRVGAGGLGDPVSERRAAAEFDFVPGDVGAVHAQVDALRPGIGGAEGPGEMGAVGVDQGEVFFRAVHVEGDEREVPEGFERRHVERVGDEGRLEHGVGLVGSAVGRSVYGSLRGGGKGGCPPPETLWRFDLPARGRLEVFYLPPPFPCAYAQAVGRSESVSDPGGGKTWMPRLLCIKGGPGHDETYFEVLIIRRHHPA